ARLRLRRGRIEARQPVTLFGVSMINHRWWLLALGACTSALGAQTRPTTFGATETRPNQLTDAERVAGWRLLFDGRTLAGWRGLGYDTVPTAHWKIVDGTIKKIASGKVPRVPDGRPPSGAKHLRPVGEWNQSRVVFRGNHGEHWLNGEKIVEFELGTARMDSALAASKYHSIPGFAERRKGHIVLQDHGDEVYFRSIKVRVP